MDAIELLTEQHRRVDRAFGEFSSTTDTERKRDIARQVIRDLSVHSGIEEAAFYPTIKDALPDMTGEIDHDLKEHAEVKQLLERLEGMDPNDPDFEPTFQRVIDDTRHHVQEEENDLFPRVRQALTTEELDNLGETMRDLEDRVPTRPHPRAPQQPPANEAVGPAAGVVDRLRDAIRGRIGKRSV